MLLIPALVAALLQGVPGHRYTFRMTPAHGDRVAGTVREDGRTARIDFDAAHPRDDEYILVSEGRLMVVHPDEREYSVVDDSTFERIVGVGLQAASDVGVVGFRVRDVQFTPERLGPGGTIGGLATQHVRLTEEFSVVVSAFGLRGDGIHMRVVSDYWVTDQAQLMHNPVIEMLSRLGTALGQSDPSFVRRQIAARRALFSGTPLKIVITTWSSEADDRRDHSSVQTIEIADLTPTSVDPAIFRIPPGLTRRDGEFSWHF